MKEHIKRLRHWAKKGKAWAQTNLGSRYRDGEDVKKDEKRAANESCPKEVLEILQSAFPHAVTSRATFDEVVNSLNVKRFHWPKVLELVKACPECVKEKTTGGELPLHLLMQNPKVTIQMVTTLLEAWPECVKEMTTVVKDNQGKQTGGELPIHLLVQNPNVTTEMMTTLLEAWPECVLRFF